MHLIGTDLDLKRLSGRSDQRCVQGLIHIRLRHRDIVLKASRDRLVHLMDHTERRITVLYGLHDNTDRKQIIDLVDRLSLVFHLFIDTEKMLCASLNIRLDACRFDALFHLADKLLHIIITHTLSECHLLDQIIVRFRFEILE